jgi:hypothetical protein
MARIQASIRAALMGGKSSLRVTAGSSVSLLFDFKLLADAVDWRFLGLRQNFPRTKQLRRRFETD